MPHARCLGTRYQREGIELLKKIFAHNLWSPQFSIKLFFPKKLGSSFGFKKQDSNFQDQMPQNPVSWIPGGKELFSFIFFVQGFGEGGRAINMFATFNTLGIKRPFDSDVLNTPFLYMIDIAFFELLDFLVLARPCEAKCLIIEEGLSRSLVFDLFSSSFRLGTKKPKPSYVCPIHDVGAPLERTFNRKTCFLE